MSDTTYKVSYHSWEETYSGFSDGICLCLCVVYQYEDFEITDRLFAETEEPAGIV